MTVVFNINFEQSIEVFGRHCAAFNLLRSIFHVLVEERNNKEVLPSLIPKLRLMLVVYEVYDLVIIHGLVVSTNKLIQLI